MMLERKMPLYQRVMGDRFATLPAAVRLMHEIHGDSAAVGDCSVISPGGVIASFVRKLFGFPPAGDYPVRVTFALRDGVETWTRQFGEHRFTSRLLEREGKLAECFGALRFEFNLPSDERGLRMVLTGWDFLGVPLSRILAPRIEAAEWEERGWFRFDVSITLPVLGQLIRYSGRLKSEARGEPA
jgi:hypothetical protein